jgi:hypothetical protein
MNRRRRLRLELASGLLVCAVVVAVCPVDAQTVRGYLLKRGDDQPIGLASIVMLSAGGDSITSSLSRSNGFFEVSAPDAGDYLLVAKALGYADARVGLFELGDGGVISVEFRLHAQALSIEGLIVSGTVHQGELIRNGFFARMQRGTGYFFTPADLASATEQRTIDLIQGLAGVRRQADGGDGERVVVRGASGYCVPGLIVDGVRVTWKGTRSGLDDIVPKETLLAAEIHRGVTGIPIEFGSFNNCGLLVFWTK